MRPSERRGDLGVVVGVTVLAAVCALVIAVAGGRLAASSGGHAAAPSCTAPHLDAPVVSVQLTDMQGSDIGSDLHGPMGWSGMMVVRGMMRLRVAPSSVRHGAVSFRVENVGHRDHELVVLPLAADEPVGARVAGADGTVDESGSLGEASATCAPGSGDGIAPHAIGWVTLRLPAGRYELACNRPGHYAAGMHAELDVT